MDSFETHKLGLLATFLAFFGLDVLDVVSTFAGLAYGHLEETNPLAVYFMGELGLVPGLLILKAIFLVLIGVTAYVVLKDIPGFIDDDVMIVALIVLDAFGLLVLSNNFALLGWPFPFRYVL